MAAGEVATRAAAEEAAAAAGLPVVEPAAVRPCWATEARALFSEMGVVHANGTLRDGASKLLRTNGQEKWLAALAASPSRQLRHYLSTWWTPLTVETYKLQPHLRLPQRADRAALTRLRLGVQRIRVPAAGESGVWHPPSTCPLCAAPCPLLELHILRTCTALHQERAPALAVVTAAPTARDLLQLEAADLSLVAALVRAHSERVEAA